MTPGAYIHLDHETVRIEVEKATKLQVPLHHLNSIVCFGNVLVSPGIIARCAEDGRGLVLLGNDGRFKARVEGAVSGNVLLRRAQHEALSQQEKVITIARNIVAGKIQNSRQVLLRSAREADSPEDEVNLRKATQILETSLDKLAAGTNLDYIRGIEGECARAYFSNFKYTIKGDRQAFNFEERNRRPPRDNLNALLSFLYTLLLNDYVGAVEGVGLDPQVGFLHALRPGRFSLALDLMEELRPVLADRLALTLINRKQLVPEDFEESLGGAVRFNEKARKEVVVAFQKRKQDEIWHPLLEKKIPFGLVPHIQARLFARFLRGEAESYIPFLYR